MTELSVLGGFVAQSYRDGTWALLTPIVVLRDGVPAITVPVGFRTDGLSVPRFLWWWESPTDPRWLVAATVHDYLYGVSCQDPVSRREADRILRDLGRLMGAGGSRWLVWLGVRAFGGPHWRT